MDTRTPNELKSIVVHVSKPTLRHRAGISTEGYYKVVDGEVIMTKPNGEPVNIDGRQFRRSFGNKSGELSEREVAAMLTKEIRGTLKRGFDRRPLRLADCLSKDTLLVPGPLRTS
jgi:hypothetical protein